MTFIFDTVCFFNFESIYLYLGNTAPTANRTAEKQMHVVDACFFPLPLTTTDGDHLCVWHKKMKMSGLTSKTECRKTDKDKENVPKKGNTLRLFGNSSPTWSLTKDRPALGAKCVGHNQTLPSSQQVLS